VQDGEEGPLNQTSAPQYRNQMGKSSRVVNRLGPAGAVSLPEVR